jgi:hypothetical protein
METGAAEVVHGHQAVQGQTLFFQHQPMGQMLPSWFMVQVNLDKTDLVAAKEQGVYWIHWMVRHFQDCLKRPTK